MDDQPQFDTANPPWRGVRHVDALADLALSQVAATTPLRIGPDPRLTPQQRVDRLHTAALALDSTAVEQVIAEFLTDGITVEQICEDHIPDVARILGAQWCDDSLGFGGVTIGCARLTAALRQLERHFSPPEDYNAPQILLLVAEDVYHTLGATVMAGILRRAGFGVQLWTGAAPPTVLQHLQYAQFDAVFFSASTGETLTSLKNLVTTAQSAQPGILTIVGGTIIDAHGGPDEVRRLTGANHATKNPDEALTICDGLLLKTRLKTI